MTIVASVRAHPILCSPHLTPPTAPHRRSQELDDPHADQVRERLDDVAIEYPYEDIGKRAASAADAVAKLSRRLEVAEAEKASLKSITFTQQAQQANLTERKEEAENDAKVLKRDLNLAIIQRDSSQKELESKKVTFLDTWTSQFDDGGDQTNLNWWIKNITQIEVTRGCDEWTGIRTRLQKTLSTAELQSIYRNENRLVWLEYFTRRQRIELKRGKSNVNEGQFWHGTRAFDPFKVLQHEAGLDPRFTNKAGFYGRGVYLADNACYSNQYAHRNSKGERVLLLVRAVEGMSKDFGNDLDRDLTWPPIQDTKTKMLFDSVRGGPHRPSTKGPGANDSKMLVLYNLVQCYPEYVVTYTV